MARRGEGQQEGVAREDKERGEATGKGERNTRCSQRPGEEEQEKATEPGGLRSDQGLSGGVG